MSTKEKHGLHKHPTYSVWGNMKARCLNKNNKNYPRYGGRGITICEEWLNDFKKFYDFCMENGWKKGLDIDRIDNDGQYAPSNCRFTTHEINGQNTSRIKLNADKVREIRSRSTETQQSLAEEFGVGQGTISLVLRRISWDNV